jgi:lipopolysaccharide export system protein LptA
MRWQKAARLVIAAVVIAVAATVIVGLRPKPPKVPATAARTDPGTSAEVRGPLTHTRTDNKTGKVLWKVDAEGQLLYPDGRNILQRAVLTLPDRSGRTITVTAGEMDLSRPKDGPKEIDFVKMSKGVKLKASDGLEVTSNDATFDEKSGVLTVPGPVQFARGRMTGSGVGATYDRTRDVVWLLADAKIVVTPDEKGEGALDATASSAGLARAEHYIRLTKPAHVVSGGRTIDADDMTIHLSDDDRLVESIVLRGNSRVTGSPGASGAEGMSARDIDLQQAPDGRTLQSARLVENAVVRLSGPGGAATKQISGQTVDMTMGPDGNTVTELNVSENVQVDLPATADAPARQINSTTLAAGGPQGIQTATFTGGVTYREIRPAQRGAPATERTGRSLSLVVETQPGLGAIQQADFRGNVRIVDGATTAEGSRAIYKVAQDTFELEPSAGDPGPPPSVNDGRVLVHARKIDFNVATKRLHADTDVRSSMQPSKREGQKPDPNAKGRGAGAPASEGGKLPSMLKDDEPVNVTSNRLDYDGAAGIATYTGNAKLFQARTRIQGDTIVLDDRSANLRASGHVSSVMFFEEMDAKTKTSKLVETDATGDTLFYEDSKRLATYTTGPTAKAHIVGTQGDVTAEVIELFLKQGANELERAEADRNVVVKEGQRTGLGAHLTYTVSDQRYVITGAPVEIEEKTPTECRVTTGSIARFHRTETKMDIEGNGITPSTVKPCAKK